MLRPARSPRRRPAWCPAFSTRRQPGCPWARTATACPRHRLNSRYSGWPTDGLSCGVCAGKTRSGSPALRPCPVSVSSMLSSTVVNFGTAKGAWRPMNRTTLAAKNWTLRRGVVQARMAGVKRPRFKQANSAPQALVLPHITQEPVELFRAWSVPSRVYIKSFISISSTTAKLVCSNVMRPATGD